jgi:Xaa-Pro aminopeptidase
VSHATDEYRGRLERAQVELARLGWAGMLIGPGADLRYLTGYHAMPLERLTCLVLPAGGAAILVVPKLERPAAHDSGVADAGVTIVDHPDGTSPYPLAVDALGRTAAMVGVSDQLWAGHLLALQNLLPQARWQSADAALGPLRARKTPAEIQALAEAAAAIDAVHLRMGQWLRPGRTERQVAVDVAAAMRPSCTAPDTASGWKPTNSLTSWPATTSRWPKA